MKKKLIVVNGAPGSGKTTILSALRNRLDVTIVEKDAIKEFLFDYIGIGDREWSRALGKASIDAMFSIVDQLFRLKDVVCIETAFYAPATRSDLEQLAQRHDFDVLELFCRVDEEERMRRFTKRAATERHPGHADLLSPTETAENIERYAPLSVGDICYIDTSKEVDIDSIVRTINEFVER